MSVDEVTTSMRLPKRKRVAKPKPKAPVVAPPEPVEEVVVEASAKSDERPPEREDNIPLEDIIECQERIKRLSLAKKLENTIEAVEKIEPNEAVASEHTPQEMVKLYNNQELRMFTDDKNMLWFVANDICTILGIVKMRNAIERLDDDQRGARTVGTLGGDQQVNIINESGLYRLAFTSRKAEAKAFTRWVTEEVLPSIRKHGAYISDAKAQELKQNPEQISRLLIDLESEKAKNQKLLESHKEMENTIKKKEAEFAHSFLNKEEQDINAHITHYKTIDITVFDVLPAIYVLFLCTIDGKIYIKYGQSQHVSKRIKSHQNKFGRADVIGIYNVTNSLNIEKDIKKYLKNLGLLVDYIHNDKKHVEVFTTTPEHSVSKVLCGIMSIVIKNNASGLAALSELENKISNMRESIDKLTSVIMAQAGITADPEPAAIIPTAVVIPVVVEPATAVESATVVEPATAVEPSAPAKKDKKKVVTVNNIAITDYDESGSLKSKVCNTCQKSLVITAFNTYRRGTEVVRIDQCHDCECKIKLEHKAIKAQIKEGKLLSKRCSRCSQDKLLAEYETGRNICKKCTQDRKREKRMQDSKAAKSTLPECAADELICTGCKKNIKKIDCIKNKNLCKVCMSKRNKASYEKRKAKESAAPDTSTK